MANPARALPAESPPPSELARAEALPPTLPLMLNVKDLAAAESLRFVDVPAAAPAPSKKKEPARGEAAVLRGIKDLQQLQKQTIAVLESVKGTLDDIQQVLRSPEATRGMEKQQNAAMLLAKGFAREAVEQSQGAVALLPANPEAHLLLALSLAADAQFEASLSAARKGLALVDRRHHPLAIECGLLHALSALGCAGEAIERWGVIVDTLPLPVLFEQMARIAACFPAEGLGGGEALLDDLLNRRIARDEQQAADERPEARRERIRSATGKVEIRPDEMAAATMFSGLDAAHDYQLPCTHRAILAQIARRLQLARDAGEVVKFLGECVVPLSNRGLERSAGALARASVKRMLKQHADVMTLHRAMAKLELAGASAALGELGRLLHHWRKAWNAQRRRRWSLWGAMLLAGGGVAALLHVLFVMNGGGMAAGRPTLVALAGAEVDALWGGPGLLLLAGFVGLYGAAAARRRLELPENRGALTAEERASLNSTAVRQAVRSALSSR